MSNITGIDHIDMIVEDVEASAKFYESLGFKRVTTPGFTGNGVQLRFPGEGEQPVLELYPVVSKAGVTRTPGLAHIALGVRNLAEARAAFAAEGLAFDGEPRLIAASQRLLANVIAPDGRKVQFVEVAKD